MPGWMSDQARDWAADLGRCDVLAGISCLDEAATVRNVVEVVGE